jgi:hypothetical protein
LVQYHVSLWSLIAEKREDIRLMSEISLYEPTHLRKSSPDMGDLSGSRMIDILSFRISLSGDLHSISEIVDVGSVITHPLRRLRDTEHREWLDISSLGSIE